MNTTLKDRVASWMSGSKLSKLELQELFTLIADQPDNEFIAEALENCQPSVESLPDLEAYLKSPDGDQAYWAATFLGRLGAAANASQAALTSTICDGQHAAATQQRAVWALQQIGDLSQQTLSQLRSLQCGQDARLQRLRDEIIGTKKG